MESIAQSLLAEKRALVCGGSQGIGRACAVELARLGARVTPAARDEEALRRLCDDLPKPGGPAQRHEFLAADFSKPNELEVKFRGYLQSSGPIHILVNNTGGPPSGAILDAGADDFLQAFSNHVLCNQLLVRAVVPGMKAAGYGRIINIVSTSVIQPIRGLGVSNTTRGAVANWGRTLAAELAPFGITVNNVLPGYTDTARLRSLLQVKAEKARVGLEEFERQLIQAIPMGRYARPEEIAAVVGFLATPAASYVTGVNLPVDGGRMAVQ